jgi:quinohemoprotein ethanol dehydrogenase
MLMTADNWKGVVIDGASASRGMASFSRFFSAKDAEDVRAYVLTEARKAAEASAVPPPTPSPAAKVSVPPKT